MEALETTIEDDHLHIVGFPLSLISVPRAMLLTYYILTLNRIMNKIPLFLIVLTGLSASLYSQEKEIHSERLTIGIAFYSLGYDYITRFDLHDGAPKYSGDYFYEVGINFLFPLNDRQQFETGIEYGYYRINIKPLIGTSYIEHISLIDIPINIRTSIGRSFFMTGGALIDFDIANSNIFDNQTGIGVNLAVGINYCFNNGLSISFSPYFKAHSVIPFSFGWGDNRLLETGCRFGMMVLL
ncbi:MAG TPA: hypothetical protein VJ203_06490 [Bacteroidales bacterium]|nr:hypothetical protein [Bacteroidales bacterium]